jgi:N-acetylneuraminate synthase
MESISFQDEKISEDSRTFVIAEAGSNHNGDLDTAKKLVDVAVNAGADAVKFQTFRAENVYVEDSGQAEYLDDERSLYEIIEDMEMPYDWIPELHEYANEQGIFFMSTPSDPRAVDELEPYVPAYKVESFHLSNHPFLRYLASKDKPLILSTGAHEMDEIEEAVAVLHDENVEEFALLHCVSGYPTPLDQINVRVVQTLREQFDVPTGLSDHTLDPTTAPAAAVALGATIVEKHITLDKEMEGPDHEFALEPDELDEMVNAIRNTEQALGDGVKRLADAEKELHDKSRRFIHARTDIEAGEKLTEENIGLLSPGERDSGLLPKHYDDVLGQTASRDIDKSKGITWEDIE